jgi:hypothetical protein
MVGVFYATLRYEARGFKSIRKIIRVSQPQRGYILIFDIMQPSIVALTNLNPSR